MQSAIRTPLSFVGASFDLLACNLCVTQVHTRGLGAGSSKPGLKAYAAKTFATWNSFPQPTFHHLAGSRASLSRARLDSARLVDFMQINVFTHFNTHFYGTFAGNAPPKPLLPLPCLVCLIFFVRPVLYLCSFFISLVRSIYTEIGSICSRFMQKDTWMALCTANCDCLHWWPPSWELRAPAAEPNHLILNWLAFLPSSWLP